MAIDVDPQGSPGHVHPSGLGRAMCFACSIGRRRQVVHTPTESPSVPKGPCRVPSQATCPSLLPGYLFQARGTRFGVAGVVRQSGLARQLGFQGRNNLDKSVMGADITVCVRKVPLDPRPRPPLGPMGPMEGQPKTCPLAMVSPINVLPPAPPTDCTCGCRCPSILWPTAPTTPLLVSP